MFSAEVRKLLAEVITSWQVLAVTVILVVYIFLVNYVAALHHRRHFPMPKVKKNKKVAREDSAHPEVSKDSAASETDELGLEKK